MTKKDYYWLNKDSRRFLERGYLLEGESPEKRCRDIAVHAEKILGIKGFADKFEAPQRCNKTKNCVRNPALMTIA